MDRVALTGFARGASEYERARPGWPPEAAQAAFDYWCMTPAGTTVLDLGAGTGRLTRVLADLGADVVAVEPVSEMRAFIRHGTALDGTAERLPVSTASQDAVFVGEAFHWFHAGTALPEIARVLRPHGGLALMWNNEEWTEAEQLWRAELRDLLADVHYHPQGTPLPGAPPDYRKETAWRSGPGWDLFEPLEERSFAHRQQVAPEDFVARVASFSFVAALPDQSRLELLDRVATLLAAHEVKAFEQRWRCDLYLTRRRA